MVSIKRALNLRQAFIQILVFGVFSVAIYRFVENRLLAEFDENLMTLANTGTGMVEIEFKKKRRITKIEIEDDHAPVYDHDSIVFLIRDPHGTVHLNPDQADLTHWSAPDAPDSGFQMGSTTLPDGRPARYRSQRFLPEIEDGADYSDGEWSVTVIRERSSIDHALKIILYGCLGLGVVAVLLSVFANYLSIRRGLKPLDQIGEEVNSLEASSLNHRFHTDSLPQELKPITSKLNELLERMEAAFQREQRFTSNAAHELRTPLAELQAILQVGQKWNPKDIETDHPRDYFTDGTHVTKRMSRLLEALFALSRESPDSLDSERTEFCLTSIISHSLDSHPQASRIEQEPSSSIHVIADEELLITTFANLLGNAVSHSKGDIHIEITETGHTAGFLISNPAPNLAQEDLPHLREPFWRKEQSRANQEHLGLGLNLVENFCKSQNWTLEFSLTEEGHFCASVSNIPKAQQDPLPPQPTGQSQEVKKPSTPEFVNEPAT